MAGLKGTIADNHLSNLASKGRYGDTQIAKTAMACESTREIFNDHVWHGR